MRATMPTVPLGLDAFLAWEEHRPQRFELVGGVVRLVAGGTEGHDRISGNVCAALRVRLRGSPCSAHQSNLKVVSRSAGAVMYPDAFVRCGPRDDRRTSVDDPVVVSEVLSEGTLKHDLLRKRLAYEAMPSLRRIFYVSTDEARLDMRVRGEDGVWGDDAAEGLESTAAMPEIGVGLPLAEVYEDTELAAAPAA
jgi:Uma2 family endonuclease